MMGAIRRALLTGAVACGAWNLACNRTPDLSPPQLLYGQVECEFCKMIVSEERFAAAAAIVGEEGRVQKPAFDDVGCLLKFLRDHPPPGGAVLYVHDVASCRWLDASKAVFIQSDSLRTPMASNLAACESRAAAEALLAQYPGAIVELRELAVHRNLAAGADERSHP